MHARSLSLENVTKVYSSVKAVDNISLDVQAGEFVSFLGPSGSGKTSTLMMVAGFEATTSGHIKVAGKSVEETPPHKRNIGMVFQNYALFPHMTIAANVGFSLRMRRTPKQQIEANVSQVLETVGLGGLGDRYPKELSGGQQQRVALARALVFQPDLLLLDEPLGALDKNLRDQMQVELKRIHRTLGVTTIYVTHDQTEALTMSDRVVVFNNGKIEQVGPPLSVYHRPETEFVASFIGENNVFAGSVSSGTSVAVKGLGEVQLIGQSATVGQSVRICLRPELVSIVDESSERPPAHRKWPFEVSAVLNFGDNALAIGNVNGVPLRMRVFGTEVEKVSEGKEFDVTWKTRDVHLISSPTA